ncbi:MAG: hypothetical protein KC656_27275, partial [Myxococcales bacterium]|nr:hypothetical protein [Myxococcales bacterium]
FANVAPTGSHPALAPPRLELLSQARQRIQLTGTPVTVSIEVRNAGELPLRGTVRADAPWLKVLTESLAPEKKQQAVRVQIDPTAVAGKAATGVVHLESEKGGNAQVEFEVVRPSLNPMIPAAIGGGLALLLLLVLAGWMLLSGPSVYTIQIDPWAQAVLIENDVAGSGTVVTVEVPNPGESTITVRHPNFKPWVKDVTLEPGGVLPVELVLDSPMSFRPSPDLKLAQLDPEVAVKVMAPFQPGLDRCLRSGVTGDAGARGVVRIHVGPEGRPIGFDAEGSGTSSPTVRKCLERQAPGARIPPLADGAYEHDRYDYVIPAR